MGACHFDSKSGPIILPVFNKNMTHNSASMMTTMHILPQGKEHFSINNKHFATFFQNGARKSALLLMGNVNATLWSTEAQN